MDNVFFLFQEQERIQYFLPTYLFFHLTFRCYCFYSSNVPTGVKPVIQPIRAKSLEINLITVIYKRICKFWYITQSELNSCKWRCFH